MKVTFTIDPDRVLDASWPSEAPLPNSGDRVLLRHEGSDVEFVVDLRVFTVDADQSNAPSVSIRGHVQPPGTVAN